MVDIFCCSKVMGALYKNGVTGKVLCTMQLAILLYFDLGCNKLPVLTDQHLTVKPDGRDRAISM
jgi:hypothetical protein